MAVAAARLSPLPRFALAAGLVLAACLWLLSRGALRPAMAVGVSIDLALTIPCLYWLLVVRPGRAGWLTLGAVFAACVSLATALLPAGQRGIVPLLGYLLPVAEALTLAGLALRGRAVVRAYRQARPRSADFVEALEEALRAGLRGHVLAEVLAAEVAIAWFALLSWRTRPAKGSFAGAKKSGLGAIAFAFFVITLAEMIPAHILLARWGAKAAWLATALGAYSLFWLVGYARAVSLRGSTVAGGVLRLRVGMRFAADIALHDIAAARAGQGAGEGLSLSPLGKLCTPNVALDLLRPIEVRGLFGKRATASRLLLVLDEPDAFVKALQEPW